MNVLLDPDGTLTDPADGITACIAHVLHEPGVNCPPREALHRYMGLPLHGTFKELLAGEARVEAAMPSGLARLCRPANAGANGVN